MLLRGSQGLLTDVAMLVRMLVLTPILPVLVALAFVVLGVIPWLGWSVPTAMFTILITVEIEVLFLAALVLPTDKLLNQTFDLAGLVVPGSEIQARNALGAFVALVVAWTVPALADEAVCGIRLRL